MVKIDINEFYMSGEPDSSVMKLGIFNGWLQKAVDWLCRNQFVQSEFLPDFINRVTKGSGMGLLHSGEVADAGFWIAADRWLLPTKVLIEVLAKVLG